MPATGDNWSDEDAGPVVRPYALTRGRTKPPAEINLDLLAMITTSTRTPAEPWTLDPEHLAVLRDALLPISVADLASHLDLPLGVVRILVADLHERHLVTVQDPITPLGQDDLPILREVIDALRAL